MDQSIVIRPGVSSDIAFIYATFLQGLYHGSEYFSDVPRDTFFDNYKLVIEALLQRASVRVACLEEDPDVILGYCVYKDNALHWVYTKKPWRKMGIARALIPVGIDTVTHLTSVGKSVMPKEWKYNPFKLG